MKMTSVTNIINLGKDLNPELRRSITLGTMSCLKKLNIITLLFQITYFKDLEKSYKQNDLTLLSYTNNDAVGDKWNTKEFEYYRNLYAPSRNEYIVTEASRAPKNYLRLVLYLPLKQSLNFMNQSQKKLSK